MSERPEIDWLSEFNHAQTSGCGCSCSGDCDNERKAAANRIAELEARLKDSEEGAVNIAKNLIKCRRSHYDMKRRAEVAEKLLHGLTNEADANEAWKALVLRAEAAERERDEAVREANDNIAGSVKLLRRVRELEAALQGIVARTENATIYEYDEGMVKIARAALKKVD